MSYKDKLIFRFHEPIEESVADTRLRQLGTAGLFDARKIALIKRALAKDPVQLTLRERNMLLRSFDILLDLVTSNQQLFQRTKGELKEEELEEANSWTELKDPPPILILRRRAIRIFPDDRRVALYYSDALNKYIGIPYGDKTLVAENKEE